MPKTGNTPDDDAEFNLFFKKMDYYRVAKDATGKFWFNIPLSLSSQEEEVKKLDNITMKQWLVSHNFKSKPLYDYLDYCCRDDFGLGIEYVSAWAGIHYFAGRKQDATADKRDSVITWPEGNARLAHHLEPFTKGKTLKNHLVFEITTTSDKVIAKAFDAATKTTIEIIANKVIMATPQFVNQYIIKNRKEIAAQFHYTPWLLATLVVTDLTDNFSFPLCWDNVIYGSKGLGYVYDQHQSLQQIQDKKVITYYYSFSSSDLGKTRRSIYKKNKEYWKQLVFEDLKIAHPTIEEATETIDIHLLGHGMISPVPGFIFGEAKQNAAESLENKIFFAHSDLSGISIFEEAFHQGINVVNDMLK